MLVRPPKLGVAATCHLVPFHRSISGSPPGLALVVYSPAAQALLGEVAATPKRTLGAGRFGLGTCFQAVPFQCAIRVLPLLPPTAQASLAEVAVTPLKKPLTVKDVVALAARGCVEAEAPAGAAESTPARAAPARTAAPKTGRDDGFGLK